MSNRNYQRAAAGQQYAIVVGLVAVIAIASIASMGSNIKSLFGSTSNVLTGVTNDTASSAPAVAPPAPPAYNFTSHTFSPCGATGRNGPAQASCRSAYNTTAQGNWDENNSYFTVVGGVQFWTPAESGTYRITAAGATGGSSTSGSGAIIAGTFTITAGQQLRIIVGQKGLLGTTTTYAMGGGGGASAVSIVGQSSPLIVAGGGGGTTYNSYSSNSNRDATTDNRGDVPGQVGQQYQYGTTCPNIYWEGGGGGSWSSEGTHCSQTSYSANLRAGGPLNGSAIGGLSGNYQSSNDSCGPGGDGGFGGGGGSGSCSGTSGGGGGYSGGNAGYSTSAAYIVAYMGGGSYNTGASPSASTGNYADGYVTIVKQ